jgi:CDP-glycerol glycerophosphotransferase (TagB/SpsB family)
MDNVFVYFVTDQDVEIKRHPTIDAFNCRDISKVRLFVNTKIFISSHGPYCIPCYYLWKFFGIKHGRWVDTWHGISFEYGSGRGRAKMLESYDLGLVSSDFFRDHYASFALRIRDRLKVTGFPRTDPLMNGSFDRVKIEKEMQIQGGRKNILYAPSWSNPAVEGMIAKNLYPFGDDLEFVKKASAFCRKNNCNFLIRTHINWEYGNPSYAASLKSEIERTSDLYYVSLREYPLTESILFITDMLITDYSSIASDFLLLNRPVVYTDLNVPAEKFVFTLEERGGHVVHSDEQFFAALQGFVDDPDGYDARYRSGREEYLSKIYKYIDDKATSRSVEEIMRLAK